MLYIEEDPTRERNFLPRDFYVLLVQLVNNLTFSGYFYGKYVRVLFRGSTLERNINKVYYK